MTDAALRVRYRTRLIGPLFSFFGMRLSFKVKRRSVDAFWGILEFFNSLIYDDIVT